MRIKTTTNLNCFARLFVFSLFFSCDIYTFRCCVVPLEYQHTFKGYGEFIRITSYFIFVLIKTKLSLIFASSFFHVWLNVTLDFFPLENPSAFNYNNVNSGDKQVAGVMSGNSLDWRKTRLNDPSPGQYLPRERSAAAGRGISRLTDRSADSPTPGLQGSSAGWLLRFVFQTLSPEPKLIGW